MAAAPKPQFKVAVIGGAGGIGQPLSMLMAMNPLVKELSVQDVTMAMVPAAGVAADLSHIEYPCDVHGYAMDPALPPVDQLEECLSGCHLVLIPAGIPRKPGMTRDDLFKTNANIAKGAVEACAKHCPEAVIGIIVNPVNSVVPAMAELYTSKGLNPLKIVGITTLDVVRANKFTAKMMDVTPAEVEIPVVGGHAGVTILPLLSQHAVSAKVPADKIEALDKRIQDGGTEVVEAKAGKGSATLSMAFAGSRLGNAVLAGLAGTPTTECAYVKSTVTELPYFASKVTFGTGGVETVHPLGELNEYETRRLVEVKEQLKAEIEKGLEFARGA